MPKKKTKTPKPSKKRAPAKSQQAETELSPEELDGVTGGALISTEWVFVATVSTNTSPTHEESPTVLSPGDLWALKR